MSIPETRILYFGPPLGFYEPDRFDAFVKNEVKVELGCSSTLNVEGNLPNRTYHFPEHRIGIKYGQRSLPSGQRCLVNLMFTPNGRVNADKVQALFFRKDNE